MLDALHLDGGLGGLRRRLSWPPIVFLVSSASLVAVLFGVAGHPSGFFDLGVFREGAGLVLAGRPLYGPTFGHGMGFTYPPCAALAFTVLHAVSLRGDEIAVTLVDIALFAALAHCSMRLRGAPAGDAERSAASRAAWLAAAAALWTLPVNSAFVNGQIDVLVAVLVLVDVTRGRETRWGGLGVGAAAALKLTPLIFIPYLALSGRPRMAGRALAAFALSVAVSFAVVPGDARTFWMGGALDTSRVSGAGDAAVRSPANQSLHGALLRIAPAVSHLPAVWLVVSAAVAVFGLALAVSAARRGDEAWGYVCSGVTGLLVCPVTWVHHGVIVVPALVLALADPRWRATTRAAAAAVVVAASWAIRPIIAAHPFGADLGSHLGAGELVLGNLYVIAGLATLASAAVSMRRSRAPVLVPPATAGVAAMRRRVEAGAGA